MNWEVLAWDRNKARQSSHDPFLYQTMFKFIGRVLQKPLSSLTRGYSKSSLGRNVDVSPEVLDALSRAAPVVALESTVISHGFPYPANLDLALSLESIVRSTGAIPATIGLSYHRL